MINSPKNMNMYRISLFALALVGLFVSTYLLYTYVFGGPIVCTGHGCETVRASAQAYFFGLPTPAYGVLFYVGAAVLAWLIGVVKGLWFKYTLLLWTAVGLLVSAYLTYLEAFVIEAWCLWCVASAIVATLMWLLVWTKTTALLSDETAADTVREL